MDINSSPIPDQRCPTRAAQTDQSQLAAVSSGGGGDFAKKLAEEAKTHQQINQDLKGKGAFCSAPSPSKMARTYVPSGAAPSARGGRKRGVVAMGQLLTKMSEGDAVRAHWHRVQLWWRQRASAVNDLRPAVKKLKVVEGTKERWEFPTNSLEEADLSRVRGQLCSFIKRHIINPSGDYYLPASHTPN
ncbi:hypothetical protein ACP4OV_016427 [Aristida adscensionis]